jgi:hypothetical protein
MAGLINQMGGGVNFAAGGDTRRNRFAQSEEIGLGVAGRLTRCRAEIGYNDAAAALSAAMSPAP